MLVLFYACAFYLVHGNDATANYYYHPMETMGANYSTEAEVGTQKELMDLENQIKNADVLARIYKIDAYVESDDNLVLTSVFFTSMEKKSLSSTCFNFILNKGIKPTRDSVIVDSLTASRLKIRPGSRIKIIKRECDFENSLIVTDVVKDYAPTIGVLCSDVFPEPQVIRSVELFSKAEPPQLFVGSSITSKSLLLEDLESRKSSAFIALFSNLLNIAILIFCFALSFTFYALVFRSERKDFYIPMMCMGSRRSTLLAGYCLSALVILLCATALGLGIACAFLYFQYDLVLYVEEIVAALSLFAGLSWLGAISSAIVFLRK